MKYNNTNYRIVNFNTQTDKTFEKTCIYALKICINTVFT